MMRRAMFRTTFRSALVLGLTASLLGAAPARAAASSVRCDQILVDVDSVSTSVEELEHAVAENHAKQQALRAEILDLADLIAERLAHGAESAEVAALVERRVSAMDRLEHLQALAPVLEARLASLRTELETAERGYVQCVEAGLE